MYYFGTNLDARFSIPDFWPTQEQSHTIPREKEDIRREVERIQREIRERKELRDREKEGRGKLLEMGKGDGGG
jgi:protein PET100, fungi type